MLLGYQYDDSGNVTRIQDSLNSSQFECYGYDTSNRLVDAFTGNSACSAYSATGYAPFDHDYTYDNLHNMLSFDGPTYSYGTGNTSADGDAGPHAVVGIGGTITLGYDDNGNRITRTENSATTAYTYNPENRLASVDLPSDPDDVVLVYDADGRRVSRSHGDYSTTYVAGVMEIDRDQTTVTEIRTLYAFAGIPVATRTHVSPATTFLFQNHLGSTVAAFDDTTNSLIQQYYYPYGAERHAVGTLPLDQRYTGQTSDATGANSGDTGLLYYNARYYDPEVGAFTGADTIVPTTALSTGLNRYAYVSGNPANNTDPTGHGPFLIDLGPAGAGRSYPSVTRALVGSDPVIVNRGDSGSGVTGSVLGFQEEQFQDDAGTCNFGLFLISPNTAGGGDEAYAIGAYGQCSGMVTTYTAAGTFTLIPMGIVNPATGSGGDEKSKTYRGKTPGGTEYHYDQKIADQRDPRRWSDEVIGRAIDDHPAGAFRSRDKRTGELATAYFLELDRGAGTGQYVVRTNSGKIVQITNRRVHNWRIDSAIEWQST